MKQIEITANDAGQRLDRFLKKYLCNAPLSGIYKIIRKDVKLNGKRPKEDVMLNEGDVLNLYIMDAELEKLSAKKKTSRAKKQFSIAYEDDNILVANKPFGLLVHGDKTEKKNTLANQVIDYLIEEGKYNPRLERSFTPAPVHRLDRNTTGLVVFGKNANALRQGVDNFSKYYKTICIGKIDKELRLTGYLVKDERTNKVRVSKVEKPNSKYIETIVRPLIANDKYSLLEVELVTGRSHQIRAHLASIGHPVYGDPKYGHGSAQLLHAAKLVMDNGTVITAKLPPEFRLKAEEIFGKENINGIE
ncbi:MAG: RluA family pseudouridine synthase [Bacillota bacterium]|nr:RluA family pseudouridine synthase [Bacillota bacterium]